MQYVTPDIVMEFHPVEDALQEAFLLALFKGDTSQIPRKAVTSLPVEQAGISLPDPTQTAGSNWTASYVITGYLVSAICETDELRSGYHALLMGECRYEIFHWCDEDVETVLGKSQDVLSTEDAHQMEWIMRMGAFLSVISYTVNGTEFGVQEFRDSVFLHYDIDIPDLPKHCNGHGAAFYI